MRKLVGKDKEIISKYLGGESCPQLAKEYGVSGQSIHKLLKKNNVQTRSIKESMNILYLNKNIPDKKFCNYLSGWLMGDGGVIYRGSAQAYFQHVSKHKEYIDYVHNTLSMYNINSNIGHYLSKKSKSWYWKLHSESTVYFKNIYDRWYKNKIKIIPKDLEINKVMLMHWLFDDGSVDKRDRLASFHTNNFTFNECVLLARKLENYLGDNVYVYMVSKKYPRITLSREASKKLCNVLPKCSINCFRYKVERL